mmetsp:Transcript_58808/g.127655  ORF Transcript_58808/g.127655 Transcript_58808/m.127655 type:complete len:226 (-) Transcript_58808:131-808(-)
MKWPTAEVGSSPWTEAVEARLRDRTFCLATSSSPRRWKASAVRTFQLRSREVISRQRMSSPTHCLASRPTPRPVSDSLSVRSEGCWPIAAQSGSWDFMLSGIRPRSRRVRRRSPRPPPIIMLTAIRAAAGCPMCVQRRRESRRSVEALGLQRSASPSWIRAPSESAEQPPRSTSSTLVPPPRSIAVMARRSASQKVSPPALRLVEWPVRNGLGVGFTPCLSQARR